MVTIILLAACVLSLIFGICFIIAGKRGMAVCSRRARARVVGIYESSMFQEESYSPILEFSAGGEVIRSRTVTEKTGGPGRIPYKEGDLVEVLHNPENPHQFFVPGYDVNMKLWLGIGSLGAALILALSAFILK